MTDPMMCKIKSITKKKSTLKMCSQCVPYLYGPPQFQLNDAVQFPLRCKTTFYR